ncbi:MULTISPECIES: OsmC family protein [Cellvibrio]|uniref:Redox protein n=1 Tax=Cellvibrio fibrivorans TaxID=126350 RepID=A0ABU1UW24_9GAMM|nr:OsmC family protein [Cellvibrio fibrivorans]MDR7089379.1 putative redox protein [Cellvibrio fibrivorans]
MIKLQKDSSGTYRQRISVDAHELFADVDDSIGGEDSAPDPHDLLDSSLAACTAITLSMYAKRRGMPLEGINIDIERDDSKEKSGEYNLALNIHFVGNLSDEQKQQLLGIIEKCPIHKLLSHATINITSYHQP